MTHEFKSFLHDTYGRIFNEHLASPGASASKVAAAERSAQKEAIKLSVLRAMEKFPDIDPAQIWKAVYEVHVHRKSGISDGDTIAKVIAADQSWKKSSGHAFEEMIKMLANDALAGTDVEILLQRDLNILLKANELDNEPRDLSWLREQIKGSVFDLYAVSNELGKRFCFGCIQSKTSIRDRVTRDREPSIAAMKSFFWSVAIVLDGDFLKMPKFKAMVNGGSSEYAENGWHGMYVFSDKLVQDRIYSLHLDFGVFASHAQQAKRQWKSQRQWFNSEWLAE